MKSLVTFILCLFCFFPVFAQQKHLHAIRNYSQSMAMNYSDGQLYKYQISNYGDLDYTPVQDATTNKYCFHGQELDFDLGIYHFKSRLYYHKNKRFLQADPASQYFSPYLFVQGDPVNYVDMNGKEGKPLVLYEYNHDYPDGMIEGMQDLKADFPDAYYVPVSDFINNEVGDLSEWNGNVFLNCHAGDVMDREFEIEEKAKSKEMIRNRSPNTGKYMEVESGTYSSDVSARRLGGGLRRFSEMKKMPIKNVTIAGCESSAAAERIGQGFVDAGDRRVNAELNVRGIRNGRYNMLAGRKSIASQGDDLIPYDRTRFHINAAENEPFMTGENLRDGRFRVQNFSEEVDGRARPINYIEGEDLRGLMNGRVPEGMASEFETFRFVY